MPIEIPEELNLADFFLDARVREGRGHRTALLTDQGARTYADVQRLANRFGHLLKDAGVEPEERVIVALPDSPEYVGAFFGILKLGAVVVMVNPQLDADAIGYFLRYTRARAAFVHRESAAAFQEAAAGAPLLRTLFVAGEDEFARALESAPEELETFPSHRDDAAIWLFSGGTTGRPKAVVQSHNSFVNTTEAYARQVLHYGEDDVTLSVPKLYFGYATGSNLLFPFAVGAAAVLFPERVTADVLFAKIAAHRPTILINVPTMVRHMVSHEGAREQDLSCLRLATSAGEALPVPLHERWNEIFGVELLDGLGTAEMWHVFLSNRPGDVTPGTLGKVVPGFDVKVADDHGHPLPDGETGWLWVRGNSRAQGYWQQMEKTTQAFRGEWYVSGDMLRRNADGTFVYCGRGDDMLKVSGKWLAPQEVENCLLEHAAVREVAVVGVEVEGLIKPKACVRLVEGATAGDELAGELQEWVKSRLEPYKYPRQVEFFEDFPRTHLGKVDRGQLKRGD